MYQGESPICVGQQTAVRFINSVVKEESWQFQLLLIGQLAQPGLASELKCGLGSLSQKLYATDSIFVLGEFIIFLTRKKIFEDHISLKKKESVIHIFLYMLTGT